jgi:transposase
MFWGVLTSLGQHLEILLSTWQGGQKIDMGRTKYTTAHLLRVKELLQAGFSTREIATKLSINKSSIAELAKWVPESEYVKRTLGRPLLLSSCQQTLLTRGISKNSYTLATEASAYWLRHYQLCLSRQTITRTLK